MGTAHKFLRMRINYDDEVVYDADQEVKTVDMLKVLGLENLKEQGFRLMIPPMTLFVVESDVMLPVCTTHNGISVRAFESLEGKVP